MLKETFLAEHGLLVLRTHAKFSSLIPSAHQSRMFAAKILNAGWHNAFFPFFVLFLFPWSALHYFTERLSEAS